MDGLTLITPVSRMGSAAQFNGWDLGLTVAPSPSYLFPLFLVFGGFRLAEHCP